MTKKTKLVIAAVVLLVVVGVLAYFNYVPFWVSVATALALAAGYVAGWKMKKWSDEHVGKEVEDEED